MHKIHLLITFALMFCLAVSCKTRPDYVIDEETMTDLLFDVHMSEGLLEIQSEQNRKTPEYGQEVMAAVLMKHDVSKEQYDTSLVWYSQNLQKLIRIYNKVNKRIDENTDEWQLMADNIGISRPFEVGDSINIWRYGNHIILDEYRLTAFRVWTIAADTTFHKGDTMQWQMHLPRQVDGQGIVASISISTFDDKTRMYRPIGGTSTGLVSNDTMLVMKCAAQDETISQVIATLHALRVKHDSLSLVPTYADSINLIRLHKE